VQQLYDKRPNSLGADRLASIPGWSEMPGVRAGNVLPWNPEPPLTDTAAACFVNGLAQLIRDGFRHPLRLTSQGDGRRLASEVEKP
jgi:hypothetical protein